MILATLFSSVTEILTKRERESICIFIYMKSSKNKYKKDKKSFKAIFLNRGSDITSYSARYVKRFSERKVLYFKM